jgi:hypothetical protein
VADESPNTYERDDNGLVTIHLGSKRVVKIKELRQSEADIAASLSGAQGEDRLAAQVKFSIREIDGAPFDPKTKEDLAHIGGRFSVSEFGLLTLEYMAAFKDEELDEQAKKLVERLGLG